MYCVLFNQTPPEGAGPCSETAGFTLFGIIAAKVSTIDLETTVLLTAGLPFTRGSKEYNILIGIL
jgi:hypothetical protein